MAALTAEQRLDRRRCDPKINNKPDDTGDVLAMITSTMRLALMFALVNGCEDPDKRGPPPDPSVTETGSEDSSTSEDAVDPCAAFSGCMDVCTGDDCPGRCASATDSDELLCMTQRCSALSDACAQGDSQACADVLACVDSSTSGVSDSSSSTEGSSTT